MMTMTPSPPGPLMQKLNTLTHAEPYAAILYCVYWCLFLAFWTPLAIIYLQISAIFKLIIYYFGRKQQIDIRKKQELAVFITGCDSGIGKELALWACDAGFVVFAGCLQEDSVKQASDIFPNLIPFKLDVTSDEDVNSAVQKVSDWLNDGKNNGEGGQSKQRALHALVNNAGIIANGEVDWVDMDAFQRTMDGKLHRVDEKIVME